MRSTRRPAPTLAIAVLVATLAAEIPARVLHRLPRRVVRLRDDGEAGAQVVEYALLGGVAAAACSALVFILRNPEVLRRLVDALLTALIEFLRSWF